jgi:glycosyltransferase involved in cell wall biosynthesis
LFKDGRNFVVAGIPAYNEQKAIGEVIVGALKYVDAVVVVDDCSSDSTVDVAKNYGVTVVQHKTNQGYGAAIMSAFRFAKRSGADILVTLDGDGQHDPEEIPLLLESMKETKADIIVGSRFTCSNTGEMPFYRKLGIKFVGFATNSIINAKIDDTQCGFRAYSKNAISQIELTESGMGASLEILFLADRYGLEMREVGISCQYFEGSSTYNPVLHGIRLVLSLIRIATRTNFSMKKDAFF